jgi:hypothetical protein
MLVLRDVVAKDTQLAHHPIMIRKLVPFGIVILLGIAIGYVAVRPRMARMNDRERVRPGEFDDIYERQHLARYNWAAQFCKDKSVADMASGTGYGSKILEKAGAKEVDGYDYQPLGQKYLFDLEKQSWMKHYDVIVSFETVEHLSNPDFFLSNVQRTSDLLILSTPYGETGGNRFHKQFWTLPQIKALLESRFRCEYHYQAPLLEPILNTASPGTRGTILGVCSPSL